MWKSQPSACVERVEKGCNPIEVFRSSVDDANCDRRVIDILHHACLEQVFEECVVHHRSPGFDLKDSSSCRVVGVSFKRFVHLPISSEQHGYLDFVD
jgi:hypothetical protein